MLKWAVDPGLIAYRDARYFMNDMLNLFERIERLRLFVNNDGAEKILVHFTKKLGNLNIDGSNCSSTKSVSRKSTG